MLPLNGVRVLEFCWIWAGPLIGQLLADLGAEVIKVEWRDRFDPYRARGIEQRTKSLPRTVWRESSPSFHSLNRNKVGLSVDLKSSEGVELIQDLAKHTDLVIDNFTSGTLSRLGLGHENLAKANPDIVCVSASGFGSETSLAAMRAYGLTVSALAGIEHAVVDSTGEFVGSPTFVISDPNAALFSLLASTAGLLNAELGRGGVAVEVSQLESAVTLASGMGQSAPEDLWLNQIVATNEPDGFVAVQVVSAPDSETSRDEFLEWCASSGIEEVKKAALQLGGFAQEVLGLDEAAQCEVYRDLPLSVRSIHPFTGPEDLVAAPWRSRGARAPLRKTAPLLGEGVDYILRHVLEYNEQRIKSLCAREVVAPLVGPE